jgi:hypothetical protein
VVLPCEQEGDVHWVEHRLEQVPRVLSEQGRARIRPEHGGDNKMERNEVGCSPKPGVLRAAQQLSLGSG